MNRIPIFLFLSLFFPFGLRAVDSSALEATEFQSLLKNPNAYQHKRVSVIGVVRGNGPTMELFRNAAAARSVARASESILVIAPEGWRPGPSYAMRLVRITGTVEAREHGFWGNPCSIHFQQIEVISERPALHPSHAIAVIANDSPTSYSIRLDSPDVKGRFTIGSKQFLELPRFNGTVKIVKENGWAISETKLEHSRRALNFDPEQMVFYYRIVDDKLEGVSPRIAKQWNWRR